MRNKSMDSFNELYESLMSEGSNTKSISKALRKEVVKDILKQKDNDFMSYLGDYFIDAIVTVLKLRDYSKATDMADDDYEDIYNYQKEIQDAVYKKKWW